MKRKSFRKAESAWCLRREEREEPRHCLVQGYCENSYPISAAPGNPCLCCELYYNIHPSCSWPSGWEKMALEIGLC